MKDPRADDMILVKDFVLSGRLDSWLRWVWQERVIKRKPIIFICESGKKQSAFLAWCALCYCFQPPENLLSDWKGDTIRASPAGRSSLSADTIAFFYNKLQMWIGQDLEIPEGLHHSLRLYFMKTGGRTVFPQ
mmetsp:Transcript_35581/g.55563  ORF Transcript_35581/g.55563 Transcript_35581/m.55563 type:complete len:133 (-) Transcript_35581:120-518(-)